MKKISSFLKNLGIAILHFLAIAAIFWLINLCDWFWLKVSLYVLFGTVVLIDFFGLFFRKKSKARLICSKILLGIGVIFSAGFSIWFLNFILRSLNVLFWLFGSDFRIGWIFSDVWNIVFSPTGLLAGITLFIVGFIMNEEEEEKKNIKRNFSKDSRFFLKDRKRSLSKIV